MDDLAQQLTSIIESPDGMEMLKTLADSLLGGGSEGEKTAPEPKEQPPPEALQNSSPLNGLMGMLGGGGAPSMEIETIMKISNLLKSGGDNDRARLLQALRPYLSDTRQQKVDKAVKLLKIIEILPLLKESGLVDLF